MRILITGGTGFIGSHLVPRLLEQGHEVALLTRSHTEMPVWWGANIKVVCHQHNGSIEDMLNVFQQAKPDLIYHLATHFVAEHSSEDLEELVKTNVLFSMQVVEAMAATGVSRIVIASTVWTHFQNKEYSPVSLYAATKKAFENILQFYSENHGFKVISLELYDTYGPYDYRPKLIPLLLSLRQTSEPVPLSLGEQPLSLTFVEDVVRAFVIAGERVLEGDEPFSETFCVRSAEEYTLRKTVEIFEKASGHDLNIEFGGRPYRKREVMELWRGEILPDWEALVDLEEGFKRTIKEHRTFPRTEPVNQKLLSFIIPSFNEYPNIEALCSRIVKMMNEIKEYEFEVIFIENGSTDQSDQLLRQLHKGDKRIKMVKLSRNFGYQGAISAGLKFATGDWVAVLDGDQQDPPELIPDLLKKAETGFDIVYGVREKRLGSRYKNFAYKMFYRIYSYFSEIDVPRDAGEFCVMSRRAVEAINRMPERQRFVRGLRTWVGFRQAAFNYTREERAEGESKFDLLRMVYLGLDGILSFSVVPLRFSMFLGLVTFVLALGLGAVHFINRLSELFGYDAALSLPPGLTQINLTIIFLFGITIFSIGVVGEYIGRIYNEVKKRPLFLVEECAPEDLDKL